MNVRKHQCPCISSLSALRSSFVSQTDGNFNDADPTGLWFGADDPSAQGDELLYVLKRGTKV
jgi:hypothetical protein